MAVLEPQTLATTSALAAAAAVVITAAAAVVRIALLRAPSAEAAEAAVPV